MIIVDEVLDTFRLSDTTIDGLPSHFIKVASNKGEFEVQDIVFQNTDISLNEPWLLLEKGTDTAYIQRLTISEVKNENPFLTDIFKIQGRELRVENVNFSNL